MVEEEYSPPQPSQENDAAKARNPEDYLMNKSLEQQLSPEEQDALAWNTEVLEILNLVDTSDEGYAQKAAEGLHISVEEASALLKRGLLAIKLSDSAAIALGSQARIGGINEERRFLATNPSDEERELSLRTLQALMRPEILATIPSAYEKLRLRLEKAVEMHAGTVMGPEEQTYIQEAINEYNLHKNEFVKAAQAEHDLSQAEVQGNSFINKARAVRDIDAVRPAVAEAFTYVHALATQNAKTLIERPEINPLPFLKNDTDGDTTT